MGCRMKIKCPRQPEEYPLDRFIHKDIWVRADNVYSGDVYIKISGKTVGFGHDFCYILEEIPAYYVEGPEDYDDIDLNEIVTKWTCNINNITPTIPFETLTTKELYEILGVSGQ